MTRGGWIGSIVLLLVVVAVGVTLVLWKSWALAREKEIAASQPEPAWAVTVAIAKPREHRRSTTAIGTVHALQSITLHNELPGTVAKVALVPGAIVEAGDVLVALDVAVEQAELQAHKATAAMTETVLGRIQRAHENRAASDVDVDRARAERDVALANVGRIEAIIARKTVRAPFRARVGMADVHVGQYLPEGTQLTTLQGVDGAVHVDFPVDQRIARALRPGDTVEVVAAAGGEPVPAAIVALDARVDETTRTTIVRARLEADAPATAPAPGAAVRVRILVGETVSAVAVPVSALRKGPGGDHVFAVADDAQGKPRVQVRAVQSGPTLGDEVVILTGLQAGERVAASGSFKLYPNALVKIAEPPAETPTPAKPAPANGESR